ncbi:class I SAM-dependent methyltransferase [Rossellomorea marisflavi]|uniref:class I SAM-dependent methyltransferase n=1 Tax=Rossellomorea marisflavi TaxID=189381 RepID=UPI00345A4B4D
MQKIKDQLTHSYNAAAISRDRELKEDWKAEVRSHFLSLLIKENKTRLLEIGAGSGQDSVVFKEAGLNTFSTDLSPEAIRLCKEKGLKAEVMSYDSLTFPDGAFDAVWAMNCLLHCPKDELPGVLEGIKRVLKPGGVFFMGVYGGKDSEGIWEGDFYEPKRFFALYTNERLIEILERHFKIESFRCLAKEELGRDLDFQGIILRRSR